jgi:O-antigen/teichoic acid export membrane protein
LTQLPPARARNNTKVVGRNFIFMGLEVVIMLASTMITAVFIARIIGPTRLGYYNLVMYVTMITSSVGSLGIPLTTFKYMGEFLGAEKKELARAVFVYSLRAQTVIASILSAAGMIVVFTIVPPQNRVYSVLLVLCMVPGMVTFVPSQANTAAESSAFNTRAAFIAQLTYVIAVSLSLLLGWGLVGIATGLFLSRIAELVAKIVPVFRSMATVPRCSVPPEIRRRMFTFSGLSTGLMLLQIVVWGPSDIVLLKLLQSDIRQVTFFSFCFSVADQLMRVPQTFATAISATQMAEYGRDKTSLFKLTSHAAMYVLMGALPLLIGVACVAGPFIRVVYGPQYLPAIPVLVMVALLSIPRAVLSPAQTLLYATEDLGFILKCGCVAGLVDILLDFALIPGYGATGAALANGIAQTLGVAAIWSRVLIRYPVRINVSVLARLAAATSAMTVVVLGIVATPLSPTLKLIVGIPAGALVFLIMSRAFMVLQQDDRQRLLVLSAMVPLPVRSWFTRLIDLLVPVSA